ncbi:unnamed protein product [Linum trigynum]|uniref:Gnk2-homologous domain-containing protein n=1 Tax=Linum trigynum TaxID=586398 RepID=A0AAV2D1P7_9ROSI
MATAVCSRLIAVTSSIFLLLVAAEGNSVFCHNIGGCDAGTAGSLVRDLAGEVPGQPNQLYCNVQEMPSGSANMYGYGYCSTRGRSLEPEKDCNDCLTSAGNDLVNGCRDVGGAGEVWGPNALCYILMGLTNKCA